MQLCLEAINESERGNLKTISNIFFFTKVCMYIYINSSCVINKKDECKHRDSLESNLWSLLLLKSSFQQQWLLPSHPVQLLGHKHHWMTVCCVLSQIYFISVKSVEITFLSLPFTFFFLQYLWKLLQILKWWSLCLIITVTN